MGGQQLADVIRPVLSIVPALIGGAIDYARQVTQGVKRWSIIGFLVHAASAGFWGWVCLKVALYLDYEAGFAGAMSGAAGWAGARMGDLGLLWLQKQLGVTLAPQQSDNG